MTHPDKTLEKELRKRGYRVQINWEVKGPKHTEIAWMTHMIISGDRGEWGTAIVQTFKTIGWNVYVIATDTNEVEATIAAVIKAVARDVKAANDWTDQCHAADRAKERSE